MTSSLSNTSFRYNADWWLTVVTRAAAVLSAAVVLMVIAFVVIESVPALRRIGMTRFIHDDSWHPLSDQFNLLPMIVATLVSTAGATLIAMPLGICSAVFGCFYASGMVERWHRRLIELQAGIPSVVFGLWGLVVLVPLLAPLGGSGQSLLAATLILSLMILPLIALTARAALSAVPPELIAGGAALGLGRRAIVIQIALPAARGGIASGLLLAMTRAMGETMAVVMVAGNVVQMPDSIVSPVRTLTGNMALEMGYATSAHRSVLFVSGLVLLLAVLVLVVIAERIGVRRHG